MLGRNFAAICLRVLRGNLCFAVFCVCLCFVCLFSLSWFLFFPAHPPLVFLSSLLFFMTPQFPVNTNPNHNLKHLSLAETLQLLVCCQVCLTCVRVCMLIFLFFCFFLFFSFFFLFSLALFILFVSARNQ